MNSLLRLCSLCILLTFLSSVWSEEGGRWNSRIPSSNKIGKAQDKFRNEDHFKEKEQFAETDEQNVKYPGKKDPVEKYSQAISSSLALNQNKRSQLEKILSAVGKGMIEATNQVVKGMVVGLVIFMSLEMLLKHVVKDVSDGQPFGSTGNGTHPLINPKALSSLTKHERDLMPGLVDGQKLGINFEDIAGLKDVKAAIISALKDPLDYPELYNGQSELLRPPKGVLLYGPPGCGKTMLAKAIAKECKANFLMITPSSLLRKYVGDSNLLTRALFSLARKIQPCIIFIDEVDGLFNKRSSSEGTGNEVLRDVKTEFMQLWEGLSTDPEEFIVVLGATNQPWDIDPAFHRRFARAFHVGMPNVSQREECLRILLKDIKTEKGFGYWELAELLDGYSPADIKELCRVATQAPIREAQIKLRRRQEKYKAQLQDSARDQLKSSTDSKIPIAPSSEEKIELRSLRSSDVLRAQNKVLPTNWQSAAYKSLVDKKYDEQDWWRN